LTVSVNLKFKIPAFIQVIFMSSKKLLFCNISERLVKYIQVIINDLVITMDGVSRVTSFGGCGSSVHFVRSVI